jgi:hypothetical protein
MDYNTHPEEKENPARFRWWWWWERCRKPVAALGLHSLTADCIEVPT